MKRYIIKCEVKKYQTTLFLIEGINLYICYKMLLILMFKLLFVKLEPEISYDIAIFLLPSVFYRPFRLLSPHPLFIPSSAFYPLIRLLSSHLPFILPSAFYPLIRLLSSHPPFIPSSAFYPLIRLLSFHPLFIPSSAIRIRPLS